MGKMHMSDAIASTESKSQLMILTESVEKGRTEAVK
jgi:hypothetical protein